VANGTHAQTDVDGFFGLGDEQKHKTAFSFNTDHPEVFASEDHGATPVEYVLVGLAGCLTAGVTHWQLARQLNLAASGVSVSAALAPMSASTLTPFCAWVVSVFAWFIVKVPHSKIKVKI
jgi:uncharacterized OsmC-like protein